MRAWHIASCVRIFFRDDEPSGALRAPGRSVRLQRRLGLRSRCGDHVEGVDQRLPGVERRDQQLRWGRSRPGPMLELIVPFGGLPKI